MCRELLQSVFTSEKWGARVVKPVCKANSWVRFWNSDFLLVQLPPPDPVFPLLSVITCPQYPWSFFSKIRTIPYTRVFFFFFFKFQGCVRVAKQKQITLKLFWPTQAYTEWVQACFTARNRVHVRGKLPLKRHDWKTFFCGGNPCKEIMRGNVEILLELPKSI